MGHWRSWLARFYGIEEVIGSNPICSTTIAFKITHLGNSVNMIVMKKHLPVYIILVAVLLSLVSGSLYYFDKGQSAEKLFYSMIENGLTNGNTTRTVSQDNQGQQLRQIIQSQTGETNIVSGVTFLMQGEGESATSIKTESVGTPEDDYIKYAEINTSQKGLSGDALDFNSVVDVWGKSDQIPGSVKGGELFGEAVLGIVPIGTLDSESRKEMIKTIREINVYNIDFSSVKKSKVDGRATYTYQVEISPDKYITMLKKFGEIIGTNQLEALNPEDFAERENIKLIFEIDAWSSQLRKVAFTDSERMENYQSWGLVRNVEVPADSISVTKLQELLQSIQ